MLQQPWQYPDVSGKETKNICVHHGSGDGSFEEGSGWKWDVWNAQGGMAQQSFMCAWGLSVTSHCSVLQWSQCWLSFFLQAGGRESSDSHAVAAWCLNLQPLLAWVVPSTAMGLLLDVELLADRLALPGVYGFELSVGFGKDNYLLLWLLHDLHSFDRSILLSCSMACLKWQKVAL